jgi:hypothetical protein
MSRALVRVCTETLVYVDILNGVSGERCVVDVQVVVWRRGYVIGKTSCLRSSSIDRVTKDNLSVHKSAQ